MSKEYLKLVAKGCLRHRIGLNFEAEADGVTADHIVDELVSHVEKSDRDPIAV